MSRENRCNLCFAVRYLILGMVMLMMIVVYLTRVNMSVTILAMVNNTVKKDNNTAYGCPLIDISSDDAKDESTSLPGDKFDWDPKTQGLILGSFFYGYITLQIIGGRLAEIWGAKWICGGVVLLGGVINVLTPLIAKWSLAALVTSRVILGMAQSVDIPAGYALLMKWFPKQQRSTAIGFATAGISIGTIIAMSVSGWISSTAWGWTSVFYVSGAATGIWFILWVLLIYSEPKDHPLITSKELEYIEANNGQSKNKRPSVPWIRMLTSKSFITVTLCRFTTSWNFYFVLTEVPSFLELIYHYSIVKNGVIMSCIYLSHTISVSIGGIASDWIINKKYVSKSLVRKGFEIIAACGSSICLALIPNIDCNRTAVIALFICSMICLGQATGGDLPFYTDITNNYAATAVAIANSFANITGFVCPQFIGLVIQSDKHSRRLWSYGFYSCAAVNAVSIIAFLIFGNAERQSWDFIDDEKNVNDESSNNIDDKKVVHTLK